MARSAELRARRAAWAIEWFGRRRVNGKCPKCTHGQLEINPRTGDYFWRCQACREKDAVKCRRRYAAAKARSTT